MLRNGKGWNACFELGMFAPSPFFTIFMSLTFLLVSSSKLSHSLASEDTPPFARNSRFLFPLFTLLPLRLSIISPRKPSLIPPLPPVKCFPIVVFIILYYDCILSCIHSSLDYKVPESRNWVSLHSLTQSFQSSLFATLWTAVRQAPLSMGFSRQEYWSGFPFPPLGDLSDLGSEPASFTSPAVQADCLPLSHQGSPSMSHESLLHTP